MLPYFKFWGGIVLPSAEASSGRNAHLLINYKVIKSQVKYSAYLHLRILSNEHDFDSLLMVRYEITDLSPRLNIV